MNRLAATTAIAAVLLSAGAASASEYRIPIHDLDFATAQGAATFDRRIQGIAQSACVSGSSLDQARCRRAFRIEAMERLPDAQRQDYARARTERMIVQTPVVRD